jgi:hypothetical protein
MLCNVPQLCFEAHEFAQAGHRLIPVALPHGHGFDDSVIEAPIDARPPILRASGRGGRGERPQPRLELAP